VAIELIRAIVFPPAATTIGSQRSSRITAAATKGQRKHLHKLINNPKISIKRKGGSHQQLPYRDWYPVFQVSPLPEESH
jgi:hypothetical protein